MSTPASLSSLYVLLVFQLQPSSAWLTSSRFLVCLNSFLTDWLESCIYESRTIGFSLVKKSLFKSNHQLQPSWQWLDLEIQWNYLESRHDGSEIQEINPEILTARFAGYSLLNKIISMYRNDWDSTWEDIQTSPEIHVVAPCYRGWRSLDSSCWNGMLGINLILWWTRWNFYTLIPIMLSSGSLM